MMQIKFLILFVCLFVWLNYRLIFGDFGDYIPTRTFCGPAILLKERMNGGFWLYIVEIFSFLNYFLIYKMSCISMFFFFIFLYLLFCFVFSVLRTGSRIGRV